MANSSSLTAEKVIFLDVDGVLNTVRTAKLFGYDFINDNSVALVARIVRATDAKIVLSSSWRKDQKDKKMVEEALERHGLEIFDCTPVIKKDIRGAEIQLWLGEQIAARLKGERPGNRVEKFAILDDDPRANIKGSFFQTNETIGLTAAITEQVIAHLS